MFIDAFGVCDNSVDRLPFDVPTRAYKSVKRARSNSFIVFRTGTGDHRRTGLQLSLHRRCVTTRIKRPTWSARVAGQGPDLWAFVESGKRSRESRHTRSCTNLRDYRSSRRFHRDLRELTHDKKFEIDQLKTFL